MPDLQRKPRTLHLPITLSVVLMTLNVVLMVCWIVLFAQLNSWSALTIGTIAFAMILLGLVVYMTLTIKEIRLNRRQANFIDSVTHELKTPIASLRLYLETLQMRTLDDDQRAEFYDVMGTEIQRLDGLINQLLEVGRLDAIGHESDPEDVSIEPLLKRAAESACAHHKVDSEEIITWEVESAVIHARPMILDMIFGNLIDNAIKYGGDSPEVDVQVKVKDRGRVVVRIGDNGEGIPSDMTRDIFQMFYRGGKELERKKKGTGIGLYIVRTLVLMLKGKIRVHDRLEGNGSVFEVELPGRVEPCES